MKKELNRNELIAIVNNPLVNETNRAAAKARIDALDAIKFQASALSEQGMVTLKGVYKYTDGRRTFFRPLEIEVAGAHAAELVQKYGDRAAERAHREWYLKELLTSPESQGIKREWYGERRLGEATTQEASN